MTTSEGNRFYLNVMEEEMWDKSLKDVTTLNKKSHLLPVSFAVLQAKADQEVFVIHQFSKKEGFITISIMLEYTSGTFPASLGSFLKNFLST